LTAKELEVSWFLRFFCFKICPMQFWQSEADNSLQAEVLQTALRPVIWICVYEFQDLTSPKLTDVSRH
jgi:hypothetical protein